MTKTQDQNNYDNDGYFNAVLKHSSPYLFNPAEFEQMCSIELEMIWARMLFN